MQVNIEQYWNAMTLEIKKEIDGLFEINFPVNPQSYGMLAFLSGVSPDVAAQGLARFLKDVEGELLEEGAETEEHTALINYKNAYVEQLEVKDFPVVDYIQLKFSDDFAACFYYAGVDVVKAVETVETLNTWADASVDVQEQKREVEGYEFAAV